MHTCSQPNIADPRAFLLARYGDTPKGMVSSAFEFADICRDMDYHNFLFSMKASNPVVMVQVYLR